MKITRYSNYKEVAKQTLSLIENGNVAISGGSTYEALFPYWAEYKDVVNAEFFPVDERLVSIDDKDSNWGKAKKLFFDKINDKISIKNFANNLTDYKHILEKKFNKSVPVFDAVFLGIGDDGHTASLFPGSDYLSDISSILLQTISPILPANRVTLGAGVIRNAKQVVIIANYNSKKEIIDRFLNTDTSLPITIVVAMCKTVELILVD